MGMIVGTGISEIVEKPGNSMNFDLEDMKSAETQWYLSLTKVQDDVGTLETIKALLKPEASPSDHSQRIDKEGARSRPSKIEEILDPEDEKEESDEDDDLIPYEKPDEDAEDDDEDPTLVQRNKPTAPV